MSIYTPYTYLIGWSTQNKWYYGVRYAKKSNCLYETGCHPNDLWVTYFTSSKIVKRYILEQGDPDIIKIRKIFLTEEDAVKWERNVLRKMNVVKDKRWLNESDGYAIRTTNVNNSGMLFWNNGYNTIRANICPGPEWYRGMFLTETQKEERSRKMRGANNPFYGKTHSDDVKLFLAETSKIIHTGRKRSKETKDKIAESQKGKKHSVETKQKISEINTGKKLSMETKIKMSIKRKGMKKSNEHRNKIRESNAGLLFLCPHCNKEGGHGMFRWHFDNCKKKV